MPKPTPHAGIGHLLDVDLVDLERAQHRRALALLGLFGALLRRVLASCVGRQRAPEERIVGEARRLVAEDEHALLARERRDHAHVLLLERGDEIGRHLLVAHVVGKDVDALVDDHARVGKLDDVRHGDLAGLRPWSMTAERIRASSSAACRPGCRSTP